MSYRIITYRDPYHLERTFFWEEIRSLPHFCASSVMAQSMWDLYHDLGEEPPFENFFYPLDKLVNAAYKEWDGNIEKQVQQYATLSRQLSEWEAMDRGRRPELFSALRQNRNALLEALRMFCELGISPESLHRDLANKEQEIFVLLYQYITGLEGDESKTMDFREAFEISNVRINQGEAFPELINKAIRDEKKELDRIDAKVKKTGLTSGYNERKARYDRLIKLQMEAQDSPPRKIVIHGIHQFKPLQMRLITALDQAGYEIIFLYNYLPEYRHLYETWDRLYGLFDVDIEHDDHEYIVEQNQSQELAKAVAGVLNAEAPVSGTDRKAWMKAVEHLGYTPYENTSEMANYVAGLLREVKKEEISNERIMYKLPEKIYSASRDADDLLKVYFPEYAGDRHFLQYPVGQFFTCLYSMWDEQKSELKMDVMSMKICALSGILTGDQGARLSVLLDLMAPQLEDVAYWSDVEKRLSDYRLAYDRAKTDTKLRPHLRRVALYHDSLIKAKDIDDILRFVKQLKEAADFIFAGKDHFVFKEHFANLEKYIKDKVENLYQEEERSLVDDLLARFEEVTRTTSMSGTMDDLRRGLYFYMAQQKEERPGWVVRNFEQIEGDVLKSKFQSDHVTYHFAALSDGMICRKADDLLPWPLTDYFTRVVYSPVALVFQVYYASLCDRQRYMQYALFYGLYYNRGKVKLSYVRHLEDQREEQFYYPLQILNLQEEKYRESSIEPEEIDESGKSPKELKQYSPVRDEKLDFFLCPYRYYLEYVCSCGTVQDDLFLIRRFYPVLLSNLVRESHGNRKLPTRDMVTKAVDQAIESIKGYFPFLQRINERVDFRESTVNFIENQIKDNETGFIAPDENSVYGEIRERFIEAAFWDPEDTHKEHPVEELEKLREYKLADKYHQRKKDDMRYVYSLVKIHGMNKHDNSFMKDYMKKYLLEDPNHRERTGVWCTYCRFREVCKKPYMKQVE